MNKSKPVHEVRLGAIKAAIWENLVGETTRYNVTVTRIYKDGDEWKNSDSFGRDDLLVLSKVLDFAHTWIYANPPAGNAAAANPASMVNRTAPARPPMTRP